MEVKNAPKKAKKDIISFRIDLGALPEIERITALLPGDWSDKMRSIFLFGVENTLDLLDRGFSIFQNEYKQSSLRKLSFIVNDESVNNRKGGKNN